MNGLQSYVNKFDLSTSVVALARNAYYHMRAQGHEVYIVNKQYLEVEGHTYYFSKGKNSSTWIVKEF